MTVHCCVLCDATQGSLSLGISNMTPYQTITDTPFLNMGKKVFVSVDAREYIVKLKLQANLSQDLTGGGLLNFASCWISKLRHFSLTIPCWYEFISVKPVFLLKGLNTLKVEPIFIFSRLGLQPSRGL